MIQTEYKRRKGIVPVLIRPVRHARLIQIFSCIRTHVLNSTPLILITQHATGQFRDVRDEGFKNILVLDVADATGLFVIMTVWKADAIRPAKRVITVTTIGLPLVEVFLFKHLPVAGIFVTAVNAMLFWVRRLRQNTIDRHDGDFARPALRTETLHARIQMCHNHSGYVLFDIWRTRSGWNRHRTVIFRGCISVLLFIPVAKA